MPGAGRPGPDVAANPPPLVRRPPYHASLPRAVERPCSTTPSPSSTSAGSTPTSSPPRSGATACWPRSASPRTPIEAFAGYKGIILSGSPSLASHGEDSDWNKAIYDLDVPILGFCFGHQEIAKHYGGEVVHGGREWGTAALHLTGEHAALRGPGPVEQVWMSHYDSVTAVGEGFEELGLQPSGGDGAADHRFAAIGSDRLRRYGFQFHPEVDDTVHGDEMIANFVLEHLRLPAHLDHGRLRRGGDRARSARRWATAPSSCSPPAASTPRWPRCCSAGRSGPTGSTCCTSTTA